MPLAITLSLLISIICTIFASSSHELTAKQLMLTYIMHCIMCFTGIISIVPVAYIMGACSAQIIIVIPKEDSILQDLVSFSTVIACMIILVTEYIGLMYLSDFIITKIQKITNSKNTKIKRTRLRKRKQTR